MSEKIHNKLVRDKIPQILEEYGVFAEVNVLTDEEYRLALLDKLVEEARELRDSDGSIEERADVEEVIRALDDVLGLTSSKVEGARIKKLDDRGGFTKRIYLKKTTERP